MISWKTKQGKLIIAGSVVGLSVLTLGLGLGLGLDSKTSDPVTETPTTKIVKKYLISGDAYPEDQLLKDGYTDDEGRTYSFRKKDDGLYAVLPTRTVLETTPVTLRDTNFGANTVVGGANAQPWRGFENMFEIKYAGIGGIKITNDGYIWGGFRIIDYANANALLGQGLKDPVRFAKIKANGDALINLAKVRELQEKRKTTGGREFWDEDYVLDKESEKVLHWTVFSYKEGNNTRMGVATNQKANLISEISYDDFFKERGGAWPVTYDLRELWGKNYPNKPEVSDAAQHPAVEFRIADLVDKDGNPYHVVWGENEAPGVDKQIPTKDLFYKVNVTGGKITVPLRGDEIQVTPEGKFQLEGRTFQIKEKYSSYILENELEIKLVESPSTDEA